MASPHHSRSGSDASDGIEYGIPGPSGPPGIPAGLHEATAHLLPVAGGHVQQTIVQFDQKKTPTFYGHKDQDALTISQWIQRIDGMRQSLGWNDAVTYQNARAALFSRAATYVNNQANTRIDPEFATTWAWLQKCLKKRYGDCTSSREYVDIIFNLKPAPGLHYDLAYHADQIYENFDKIREAIPITPNPDVPAAGFTPENVGALIQAERNRIIDAFAYAFIVNLQPPQVRTKVLEKQPTTIAEAFDAIVFSHKSLLDEKRPVLPGGTLPTPVPIAVPSGTPRAVQLMGDRPLDGELAPATVQAINALINKQLAGNQNGGFSGGGRRRRNNNNKGGQNNQQGNLPKHCQYCQKKGHGQVECFKRKNDKAPCYNVKGEPFYPQGEEAGAKVNAPIQNAKPAEVSQGSDFRDWV